MLDIILNFLVGGLLLGILLNIGAAIIGYFTSVSQASGNEPLNTGAKRWLTAVAGWDLMLAPIKWLWSLFNTDEKRQLATDQKALFAQEDAAYARDIAGARNPDERKRVNDARREQLKARGDAYVGFTLRTASSAVLWFLVLAFFLPAMGGSWFLKFQVGREFMTGSQNLWGFPIFFNGEIVTITAVHIVCAVMVIFEIGFGATLHLAMERIEQIKKGEIDDAIGTYEFLKKLCFWLLGLLFVTEGVMGYVRGKMETGDNNAAGIFFLVAVSVMLSILTTVLAFVLKSQFKHVAPLFGWILKLILVPIATVVLGIPLGIAWFVAKFPVPGLLVAVMLAGNKTRAEVDAEKAQDREIAGRRKEAEIARLQADARAREAEAREADARARAEKERADRESVEAGKKALTVVADRAGPQGEDTIRVNEPEAGKK